MIDFGDNSIIFSKVKIALVVLLFLVLSHDTTWSQTPSILLNTNDTSFRHCDAMIMLDAGGAAGTNALDNEFLSKLIFGGHIDEWHIAQIAGRMPAQNRAGFYGQAAIELYNFRDTLFGNPHWGLSASFNTNYHSGLSFSKNLFETVFEGNKQFAGDTVSLGPLAAQFQAWQKLGLGIFNKKTWSGITLSLVEGQSYHSMIFTDASLYTSSTGDSVSMNYRGEYMRSDQNRRGWANGSGIGAALDLDYNLPLTSGRGAISVALRDIGFVYWKDQSETMQFDSTTSWSGIRVDDIFNLVADSVVFPALTDSLFRKTEKGGFFQALPASVHVRIMKFFSERDYYEAGMSIWPSRAALPQIYAGLSHFVGDHFVFSERISFGGFGRFGVGAEMQWMPRGSWLLRCGSTNLAGFTMGSARGRDIYFTIGKSF